MTSTPLDPLPSATALDGVPLLAGLSAPARDALLAAVESSRLAPGERLFQEGSGAGALYILRAGQLHASEPDPGRDPRLMRVLHPGEILDGLQELGTSRAMYVHAVEPSLVAVVPDRVVDALSAVHHDLRDAIARMHRRQSLTCLRRIFGPLDASLLDDLERLGHWRHVPRGEVIFEPAARADRLLFVISGRVVALQVLPDGEELVESYRSRGETIGEAGFLTGRPRAYRARTVRDTVLVEYSSEAFEQVIAAHPHVVRALTRAISQRAAQPLQGAREASVTALSFVAASPRAPVRALAGRVADVLDRSASVLRLTAGIVDELGREPGLAQAAPGSAAEQRLQSLLEACELQHRFVVYIADDTPSAWSRRCARHADRLILVGDPRELHAPTAVERDVLPDSPRPGDVRATLVLVHPDGSRSPSGTRYWLEARPWVSRHHHVRADTPADFERLARLLTGQACGLVLGGGGARGFAHIGLLQALADAGVPVDIVGGTSMGAFIGSQYAMGRSLDEVTRVARQVFLEVQPHRGFTLPLLSLVGQPRVEAAGRLAYGDVAIEDLWTTFFCVSANLTTAEVMVHRRGSLRQAATASANLPGISVPVVHDRQLLVDGGVLNNLPTDIMRRAGAATVIASVVSAQVGDTFTCERVPALWDVVRGKVLRQDAPRFPNILEVIMRATVLHSASRERASAAEADLAIRPDVARFGLLEFQRIDEIIEAGRSAGGEQVARWRAAAES